MACLFNDYLENPAAYQACQRYWQELVRSIAASLGPNEEWQRWISPHYADGKTPIPLEDVPIYDGRSRKLNRAFRILQYPPSDGKVEIGAWLKRYEEEYEDNFPSEELVIGLGLSDASAEVAKTLLYKWMTPTTTAEEMEAFIRKSGVGGDDDARHGSD